jgi:hypothetical protein
MRQWNEITRILQLDSSSVHPSPCCLGTPSASGKPNKGNPITAWTDVWRVYEDMCVVCAGLWMGLGAWRGNSFGLLGRGGKGMGHGAAGGG